MKCNYCSGTGYTMEQIGDDEYMNPIIEEQKCEACEGTGVRQ